MDVLCLFVCIVIDNEYVRLNVCLGDRIYFKNGRYLVVEKMIGRGNFILNDIEFDQVENRVLIIIGLNMVGKFIYMR